jgi:hypothetical protein
LAAPGSAAGAAAPGSAAGAAAPGSDFLQLAQPAASTTASIVMKELRALFVGMSPPLNRVPPARTTSGLAVWLSRGINIDYLQMRKSCAGRGAEPFSRKGMTGIDGSDD